MGQRGKNDYYETIIYCVALLLCGINNYVNDLLGILLGEREDSMDSSAGVEDTNY